MVTIRSSLPIRTVFRRPTIRPDVSYRENAADWRPLGVLCALWTIGVILDGILGSVHWWGWLLGLLGIGGVFGVASYARQQFANVVLDRIALRVGHESIPLSTVDTSYFDEDDGGPPAGARILGGALSVPKGRSALPIRLNDGEVVLAPCKDPDGLRAALQGR